MPRRTGEGRALVSRERDFPVMGSDEAKNAIEEIVGGLQEGTDYGLIPGTAKPSLWKPGAEKLCFRFNLDPQFVRDTETMEMLSGVQGLVAFKCVLVHRASGKRVGEGRGSAVLGSRHNCREPNSAVKMAQKSAQIDAALRVFALSGRFTQDLEDIQQTNRRETITVDENTNQVVSL